MSIDKLLAEDIINDILSDTRDDIELLKSELDIKVAHYWNSHSVLVSKVAENSIDALRSKLNSARRRERILSDLLK